MCITSQLHQNMQICLMFSDGSDDQRNSLFDDLEARFDWPVLVHIVNESETAEKSRKNRFRF